MTQSNVSNEQRSDAAPSAASDLLLHPLWQARDLGKPIPDSPHAASVAMPLWDHAVRYEQKDVALLEALQCGYPRFVFNSVVNELFHLCRREFAREDELCVAFPSRRIAERCIRFLNDTAQLPARIEELGANNIHVVVFPAEAFDTAKRFWQHYGDIVSSRLAQATLDGKLGDYSNSPAKRSIKSRIAELAGEKQNAVYLYPSGMSALSGALQAVRSLTPNAKTIQIGLPYVDLLRIQTKWGPTGDFYPNLDGERFEALAWQVANEPVAGVFCELPGNPLLQCEDLDRLSTLLHKYGVPLVVDETLGSFLNIDVRPYADIIVTSLTKYFSGVGDVMAGSVILNTASLLHDDLKRHHKKCYEDRLWEDDAVVLDANSQDFAERMRKINTNAEALADFLSGHPKVERVHFPKYDTTGNYNKVRRENAGYGGLLSLVLKDASRTAPTFYDRLRVSKGPSLGTNYTLACPYAILAHFDELDWVESLGVSPFIVRISVGIEAQDDLIERFRSALDAV